MERILPLLMSTIALSATAYSLYRTYWRKGNLRAVAPRTYVLRNRQDQGLYTIFPFTFYNTGARPVIIRNLRLQITSSHGPVKSVYFSAIKQGFIGDANNKGPTDYRVFAVQFPVLPGHSAQTVYCEFQNLSDKGIIKTGTYDALLAYTSETKEEWSDLLRFKLYYRHAEGLIHENDPLSMRAWIANQQILETTFPDAPGAWKTFTRV